MSSNSLPSPALAYSRPVPRYTSYPPATQFHDLPAETRQEALAQIETDQTLSLYLHLPFCEKMCYYCGCFTTITKREDRVQSYLDTLIREIELVAPLLPENAPVVHMHFGGGSPTILNAQEFTLLADTLHKHFNITQDAEIAIEADPRQMTEEKIASYAAGGMNRISFGVQDFNAPTLAAVNREQDISLTQDAVAHCRKHGIHDINFDLMYGLPHQSVETMQRTVAQAIEMNPSRIAFFGYAHVPWMKKHMNAMDCAAMPEMLLRYNLFKAGCAALEEAGYHALGIDHFVKADDTLYQQFQRGKLQRNFQGYTADPASVLVGLGASAISTLPYGYVQNKADIKGYQEAISQNQFPATRGWKYHENDKTQAAIIEAIMCYFTVDLSTFSAQPQKDFQQARERLKPLEEDQLIAWENHTLTITQEHQLMARLVASAFDSYTPWEETSSVTQRHAQAI